MNRRLFLYLSIIVLILPGLSAMAGSGCTNLTGISGYFTDQTITSNGLSRAYDLYVPANYESNRPTPLVFDFHGLNSSSSMEYSYTEMSKLADRDRFILVMPQGVNSSWNAGICCGYARDNNIDDVQFVSDLIDEISSDYCINPKAVFATGMSNGGYMSSRLACELSDRIAAVAPVAGIDLAAGCAPTRSVPVLEFHGSLDRIIPYSGGDDASIPGVPGNLPDVEETIEAWATMNGCSQTPVSTYRKGNVRCVAYENCEDGATVELCTITGGGHVWPGAGDICTYFPDSCSLFGSTTRDIDASSEIWKFFIEHPMPADDNDGDGDGVDDAEDNCPEDFLKIEPGECGCGLSDRDTDGDGVSDCNENDDGGGGGGGGGGGCFLDKIMETISTDS